MGVVYAAEDEERGETVALKVLRRLDGLAIYRFKHEFRALANVIHPNLVPLYELQSTERHWFFTMELIAGTDFLTYVRTGSARGAGAPHPDVVLPPSTETGTIATGTNATDDTRTASSRGSPPGSPDRLPSAQPPVPAAADPLTQGGQFYRLRHALAQLGAGVQALHDVGTLHRDIKPSNVIVDADGHLRLLDFGVVTELAGRVSTDGQARLIGTPAYMAPEHGSDTPLTAASDWYSVGIMLYQALTGRRPFSGTVHDMLARKRSTDPPAPADIAAMVPPDLNLLCLQLLAREPTDRPSGRDLLARLGVPVAPTIVPVPARVRSPLVGREHHMQQLREALGRASDGTPVAMFVHGRSGMGKSALVSHFCADAVSRLGATVLSGRCYEQESVPFKALDDLMDELTNTLLDMPQGDAAALLSSDFLALARLFPVLRRLSALAPGYAEGEPRDPHEQRQLAVRAFRELLRRLATRAPLIVHVDDLQWGDTDSAALLADVLRRPAAPAVLFIASYRTEHEQVGGFVDRLADALNERTELAVSQLEPAEARRLAGTLLASAGLEDQHADAIAHEARGNPFFVAELVHYVANSAARNQHGLAVTLDDLIGTRLAELPPDARTLLNVLAVAGRPIAQVVALRAAQLRGKEQHTISLLRQANLARTRGVRALDAIETFHDRTRESAYALLSDDVKRELHLRLARAMQATDIGDPEGLGTHFELGGQPTLAGPYYIAAAEAAANQLAFDRAGALYLRAIELLAPNSADRSDLFAHAADAYANAGKGRQAAQCYERAAEGASKALALRFRGRACEELLRSGHVSEGQSAMRVVLREVGVRLPASKGAALLSVALLRARIRLRGLGHRERDASQITLEQLTQIDVCWAAGMALGMSDHLLGTMLQARHLLGAMRTGERSHVTRALALEAVFSSLGGDQSRRRTVRIFERVLEMAEDLGDPLSLVWAKGSTAFARYQMGDWPDALAYAEQAIEHVRGKPGLWWERSSMNLYRLWTLFWLGKLGDLATSVPELLRDAATRGDLYAYTNFCNGFPAVAWLVRDEPDAWLPIASEAMGRWSRDAYHLQHYWHMTARCHRHLYLGEADAAMALVDAEWPAMKRAMLLDVQMVYIESLYLRARCAIAVAATHASKRERATRASRDARALDRIRVPHANALAALLRAGISSATGDDSAAIAHLERAEQLCSATGMSTNAALARRQRGLILDGDGGASLVASSNAHFARESVIDVTRLSRAFLPGHRD